MKNKKILLIGYYGAQNVGDDMFLSLLIKNLKEMGILEKNITVISQAKDLLESRFGINVTRPFEKKYNSKLFRVISFYLVYLKLIKNADVIIYGGGTQIQEFGKNSNKTLVFKVLYLLANKLFFKKPVHHFAVGIDKIKSRVGRLCTKWIYALSDSFILRDKYSYQYLKNIINVADTTKISVRTDLAFNEEVAQILQIDSLKRKEKKIKIGLSLFPYYEKQSINKDRQYKFNNEILKFCKELSSNNYEIHFIPFQSNVGNEDNIYMYNLMKDLDNVVFHNYDGEYKNTLEVISNMDICIGMRLHFAIFSQIALKPTIALSYHVKVDQFMNTLDLSENMININDFNAKLLLKKFLFIKNNYQAVKLKIKKGVDTEIKKGEGIFEELYKMVSGDR